jgi:hypothetical protein
MKQLLKKVFSEKTSSPIFIGFGVFAIFTFIVFPGLTLPNTLFNILSALIGLFTLTFVFYYLKGDELYKSIMDVEPGETELDYMSKEDIELVNKKRTTKKPKTSTPPNNPVKKSNPKQFDGIKSEEPFVKTKTNKKTK